MRLFQVVNSIAFVLLVGSSLPLEAADWVCARQHPLQNADDRIGAAKPAVGQSTGTRHGLVLFSRFRGENAGQAQLPGWADAIFDPDQPGSFTHYYTSMSFGKLLATGEVAPRWYESARTASAYITAGEVDELGKFGEFTLEILQQADAEIDFSRFDSDGPDGLPDSGDDDGVVDALFLVMASTPAGFILGDAAATGVAGLGFEDNFVTDDRGAGGDLIRIAPEQGTLQRGRNMAETVGAMAHEFGHLLGLPDLYNVSFLGSDTAAPEEDSAGIGKWGLMGWGALGWSGDRPASLSAWSRLQLGWAQVIEQVEEQEEMQLEDIGLQGAVYRIPLNQREYFLLEHRRRTGSYYDRDIPGEGLLIWHVESTLLSQESQSLVDLESADGRWSDAGFPLGSAPAPDGGNDNLDFWAHDAEYARQRGGNLGDATDLFDGVRFTAFTPETNPASLTSDGMRGVYIEQIRIVDGIAHAQIRLEPPQIEITELGLPSTYGSEVAAGRPTPITFALKNSGGSNATDLTARLRTDDPLVELLDPEIELYDLETDAEKRGDQIARQPFPMLLFSEEFDGEHTAILALEIYSHDQLLATRELSLTARIPHRVAGSVTSDTGIPLEGTFILAIGPGDYRVRGVTDENGAYELFVLPGQYDLFIRPPSGQRAASQRQRGLSIYADQQLDLMLPLLHEISGTITDIEGTPLGRIFIVVNRSIDGNSSEPFYIQTNSDGFYRFQLQRGTYQLRAIPSTGLKDIFAQQEMGQVSLDRDSTLDGQLQRGAQVTVRVTDENGRDVNGVTVQLRGAENEFHPEVLTGVQTAVNVLPGVRTVTVIGSLPSQYVLPAPFQIVVGQDTTVQVPLQTSSQVRGELLDTAGEKVDTQGLLIFTPLDGGGQFEAPVEDGLYAVGLAGGGYRIQWQNFGNGSFPPQHLGQVEIGGNAVTDFVLEQGLPVRGSVMDENRRPLDGGTLRFRSLDSGLTVSAGITAAGAYEAPLLKGDHQVAIHFLGGELPDQDLGTVSVEEDGTFDFSIQRSESLFGTVVDDAGTGLPDRSVTAYALDAYARGTVRSGAGGEFEMPLPPHRYRLALSARSGAHTTTWMLDEVEVPATGPIELAIPRGARLSGRIADGRGRLTESTLLLTRNPRELFNRAHA